MARFDVRWPLHQQRQGRDLAGRAGDGRGRLSLRGRARCADGRGPARMRSCSRRMPARTGGRWAFPSRLRGFIASLFRPTEHFGSGRARASISRVTRANHGCGFIGFRWSTLTIFTMTPQLGKFWSVRAAVTLCMPLMPKHWIGSGGRRDIAFRGAHDRGAFARGVAR